MKIIIEISLGKLIALIVACVLIGAVLGLCMLALCEKKEPPEVTLTKPQDPDDDEDGYYEV